VKASAAKRQEHRLLERVDSLILQRDGKLTQDLVLHPADFGLGNLPARLKPQAVVDMVCGFCSTGCSLRIHRKDGEAINLSPTTDFVTNTVRAGHLFIPMHYSAANELTLPAFDPYSRQPAYKACAVSVSRPSAA
jgi:predicted molibdopterin-dependent oxidoreductase YjgC